MEMLQIGEDEESGGELFGEAPNRLLSLWGKPGRESIRLLCSLAGYDFNDKYVLHKDDSTVLKKIQNRVLTYQETGGSEDRIEQDASLQIYGCPSRFREVETVYNSIVHNLSSDDGLQLTDIAVQVPDISAYKPYIDAVFNREPRAVAYNLADARAEIESLYGKGVLGILELASGRFSRPEVFALLLNPLSDAQVGAFPGQCPGLRRVGRRVEHFPHLRRKGKNEPKGTTPRTASRGSRA